jgi:hypothetical protein
MAVVEKYRGGRELRKKRRQPLRYRAMIPGSKGQAPRACLIADISETGAKVMFDREIELPDRFILMLTSNGNARRVCRVVWRTGLTAGVEFARDPG